MSEVEETVQSARKAPVACHPDRVSEHDQPQDDPRPSELDIVGFSDLRPLRPGRRRLLAYSKPPNPPNRMTPSEIDAWAGELVGEMAQAREQR